MQYLEWVIPLIILLFVANIWLGNKTKPKSRATKPVTEATLRSFQAVPSLFVNAAEQSFFHCLANEMPEGYFVMSKVRLEDIIRVKPAIRNGDIRWKLRQRVRSRHVDFLIINRDGHPVMAIELDGSYHQRPESRNADDLKDGLFKSVGVPLQRVIVGEDFRLAANKLAKFVNET